MMASLTSSRWIHFSYLPGSWMVATTNAGTYLAIETATDICSVALNHNGIVTDLTQRLSRTHNQALLGMVDTLLRSRQVVVTDLADVSFGAGPGSFTGVRIAAAVAQAIALVSNATITPVSSSLGLAWAALDRLPALAGVTGVITARRSRRDAYYVAVYRNSGGGSVERVHDDVLITEKDPLAETDSAISALIDQAWPVVGDGAAWLARRLGEVGGSSALPEEELASVDVDARDILSVRSRAQSYANPESGLPIYIAADSPWRPTG